MCCYSASCKSICQLETDLAIPKRFELSCAGNPENHMRDEVAVTRAVADRLTRGQTLFEEVYQRLRADILACRLRPGAKLQINTLAGDREVSLGVVREALTRLSAEGLVVAEPQRGFHVAPVSLEDLSDLTNTRIEIENLCLAHSIEHGGVDWETAIVGALHRLSRTPYWAQGDDRRLSEEWVTAHSAFHEALVSATRSVWLSRIRSSLYQQSERYRRLSVPVRSARRDVEEEHRAISKATLARQKARACELMKEHLMTTMNIIIKGLPVQSASIETGKA
jgi:GntR family carbon starvation induced transcriptional regulator